MLFHKFTIDERSRETSMSVSLIWLVLTQLSLAVVLFYRSEFLGQPDAQILDFKIILGISLIGYFLSQALLGGALPSPTIKGGIVLYVLLTFMICLVSLLVHGWPAADEWATTWLPALVGPAVLIGGYMFALFLGNWFLDRRMDNS